MDWFNWLKERFTDIYRIQWLYQSHVGAVWWEGIGIKWRSRSEAKNVGFTTWRDWTYRQNIIFSYQQIKGFPEKHPILQFCKWSAVIKYHMSYDQTHVPWSSQMIGIDHPYLAASISACSATRSNPGAMTYDLPCGPSSQYEPNLIEPSLLCLGTVTKKTYPLVI